MFQVKDITTFHNDTYKGFLSENIPAYRQGRYVQIVVLRETKSHAIFTTEGGTLDVEVLQAGIKATQPLDRILMYKRKQIAPERRTGRALSRSFGYGPEQDIKDDKGKIKIAKGECEIMGKACGECADCVLYGFAATTGTNSQKARVLTDSGFVIRSQDQVMRDIKLNAIKETTEGGIAGSAFASRENLLPQVFIPTVETLLDVTPLEIVYVLGNILRTTRYGAESNREGFVRNHILDIIFSDVEVFSNLELTQRFYDALAVQNEQKTVPYYLDLESVVNQWDAIANDSKKASVGRIVSMPKDHLTTLIADVGKIYSDEQNLTTFLHQLHQQAYNYARNIRQVSESDEDEDTE